MTLAEIENHREISDRFLLHADEQLARGDLPQASEKAWGAVAHYLKSEAKFRGWPNHSHRDLNDVAYDLARETNDPYAADDLFFIVSQQHINFYEDALLYAQVARGIDAARELISRLEARIIPEIYPRPSQVARENTPRPRRGTR